MKDTSGEEGNLIIDDQFRELRFNLLHSCSWVTNSMRQFLQPYELTPKQYNILRLLHDRSPESLSIQQIRDLLADRMSDASRLVDRLAKKGLLEKFPSQKDRRSNRARIKPAGSKLLLAVEQDRRQLDYLISERLSEAEIERLNHLLDRLK
jgi:DNA-binding MarR family transcriptional regulator